MRHNQRTRIPLEVMSIASIVPSHVVAPIGRRGFATEVGSTHDMRTVYRWSCHCCPMRGAWLADRAKSEANGATHVTEGCEAREAVAS